MLDYDHGNTKVDAVQTELMNKLVMQQYSDVKNIITKTKLKPLTEEQILDIITQLSKLDGEFTFESFWLKYARLIEKEHGIE